MKFIIVFAALFAVALAAPGQDAEILQQESEVLPESFRYSYETSDGVTAEPSGHLNNNVGTENEAISVRGSFSYVGDDGIKYTVTYTVDDNGYQPEGSHLPIV